MKHSKSLMAITALATALAACGGGGGSSSSGTASTSARSEGVISGFGSVIVDGESYGTTAAAYLDEFNQAVARNALRIGMSVSVDGRRNDDGTGEASRVEVRRLLRGPITDLSSGTFKVLGQPVTLSSAALTSQTLANGQLVEIYGLPSSDGISASRVDVVNTLSSYSTYGRITAVDATAVTMGGLMIKLPINSPAIAVGDWIYAKCAPASQACLDGSALNATQVRLANLRDRIDSAQRVKIKGVIDSASLPNELVIQGLAIDISRATLGESDGDESNQNGFAWQPKVGDFVEVKGSYQNGRFVASRVEQEGYREVSNLRTAGVRYSTELYGVVSAATNCPSAADYQVQSVCVDDQAPSANPAIGSYVEVKGNMQADNLLRANKVEAKRVSDGTHSSYEEKGTVSSLNTVDKTFTLNNSVLVNYASARVQGDLTNGVFVEVKGSYQNGQLVATKVEREND
ncbi:hypothetical protein DFR26_1396 [Paraperlucidibaca baekdonensis]|uniref:DUF5666 domain-containing protein n=1 Tax=Paraperlucidibaca baekdonensis TaxID=748120 RepID=A0A3E0H4S2_9GAMM|nr:DUF5666 domain-containing protein [Paraperlucidibaca baekdonensis]REH37620.1 hypothetical protein DFR26_1396 [Paraperlucidibaca baekdonensis]